MDYSRKISERMWNLPDKGELESHREATYIDDIVQKDHIERRLLENLEGIETVFDGGAGCGRFSILLAKRGCCVTHFDISQPMIDKAKELADAVFCTTERVLGFKQLLELYRIGDAFINPVDAFATLSRALLEGLETLDVVPGRLAAADYVNNESRFYEQSAWPLWKPGFHPQNTFEQTRLQCWTLKPAIF